MSTQNPTQNDPRTLRAAAVQFESLPGDKDANFRKLEAFTEQAAAQGVRLIVFPECCVTGYWFIRNLTVAQLAALAEPIPDGPSTRRLIALARKHRITIGAGLVEVTGGGVFHNSYIVALSDGTVHRHRIQGSKPQRARQPAINPRRGSQTVLPAETADCSPCAGSRISIHRAGIIPALFQRTLHGSDTGISGITRIPMGSAVVAWRRLRRCQCDAPLRHRIP